MALETKTLTPPQLRALLNAASAASEATLSLICIQRDPTHYAVSGVAMDHAETNLTEALFLVLTTFNRAEDGQLIAALSRWLDECAGGAPMTAEELSAAEAQP